MSQKEGQENGRRKEHSGETGRAKGILAEPETDWREKERKGRCRILGREQIEEISIICGTL